MSILTCAHNEHKLRGIQTSVGLLLIAYSNVQNAKEREDLHPVCVCAWGREEKMIQHPERPHFVRGQFFAIAEKSASPYCNCCPILL